MNMQEVQEELAQLRKDAERYRWLRDECHREWDVMYEDILIYISGDMVGNHEDFDKTIDYAMYKTQCLR